ncbi:MAG: right-handed parallel beta-helix repeat-containing protein [Planctomycetota bacterium]|jgi:hypothetical protein
MKKRTKILAMFFVALVIVSTAAGKIITVDDDGPADFNDIQVAIGYSKEGDTIIVAEGRYYENINLWGRNITLRSTEPNNPDIIAATIIDGGQNDSVITCENGENNNCVISGFTITNGYARGPWPSTGGGGIYCRDSAPTVMNCIFSNNSGQYGGGIFIYSETSATVTNCIFKGNSASSGGGGLCNWSAGLIVTNCTFIGNRSEYFGGGGLHNSFSILVAVNCTFIGNWSPGGGGMFNHGQSNAKLINCTFSNNSSDFGCGGIYSESKPTLTNCILWGNHHNGIMDESAQIDSRESLVNYCCIQGLTGNLGGIGNIGYDPLFVRDPSAGADGIWDTADDDLGDLHLRCGSPCLDAGINDTDPPLPSTNLDGKSRIVDGIVDMGAYEGGSQAFAIAADPVLVPEGAAATFTVTLECEPPGAIDVNVAYHSGDTDITISSGEVLTFDPDNFSDPQTVVLTAAEDSDQFEGRARFRIFASDVSYAEVFAREVENDIRSVLFVDADASGANDGTNWMDAFNHFQDALTLAAGAPRAIDEIMVAGGIYKPDIGDGITVGDREATFALVSDVLIKGGYAGVGGTEPNNRDIELYETILSGDLDGNDIEVNDPCDMLTEPTRAENSYQVVTGSRTDETAVLDGFTITGGNANGSYLYDQDIGGGMYNESGNPTIMNCTFTNNSSPYGGCMYNWLSSLRLSNCTFTHNAGDGLQNRVSHARLSDCDFNNNSGNGISNYVSNPTLTNCTFSGNSADYSGGGMYNSWSSPKLTNCTFSNNSRRGMYNRGSNSILMNCAFIGNINGGMYNTDNSNTMLTNCTFTGNSTSYEGGGVFNFESSLRMYNCIFTGNSAENEGGGVYDLAGAPPPHPPPVAPMGPSMLIGNNETAISDNWDLILINCTFADNTASNGNALALDSYKQNYPRSVQISNCILWDGGNEIWNNDGSTIAITYSDVESGWPGEGNIETDPRFVELGYWVLRDDPNIVVEPNDPNVVWIEGDYHLLPGSPCIDAGDPNYVVEPNETDLDGKPRVIGGRIDMGAYESNAPIPAEVRITPSTINPASKGRWITCYIWLPEGYDVNDIDYHSLLFEYLIEPEQLWIDEKKQVVMARFRREEVQPILNIGEVELTISVHLTDGTVFEGTNVVKVIDIDTDKGGGKLAKLGEASNPNPADGATGVSRTADLSWTAGSDATSHDVYFGTSNPPPFIRNQTSTTFDPGTMDYDKTYFWRIDEVNKWGKTTGTVWSFTTRALPGQASDPDPVHGATWVSTTADLSWTAGSDATSHDVYFGTTSPGMFQGNQSGTTFDPGRMAYSTTYYWRIDEVGDEGKTNGLVWIFKTTSPGPGGGTGP